MWHRGLNEVSNIIKWPSEQYLETEELRQMDTAHLYIVII